jgi:hypothetical protein
LKNDEIFLGAVGPVILGYSIRSMGKQAQQCILPCHMPGERGQQQDKDVNFWKKKSYRRIKNEIRRIKKSKQQEQHNGSKARGYITSR